MSKKTKTLIAALGLLIALAGGYYGSTLWSKNKTASPISSHTPTPVLGNLNTYDLAKIETGDMVLERKGDIWEISSLKGKIPPGGIALDQWQIQMMTYSLASMWVNRIVEEEPEDLSIYGLENPVSRTIASDSSGKKAVYLLGDMTPSMTDYYVMEEGDPKVYSVSSYAAEVLRLTLDNIRQRTLFTAAIDLQNLIQFRLESPESRIEVISKPETVQPHLSFTHFSHILTSPYLLTRAADNENLGNLLQTIFAMQIADFIDDNPSSLRPYGLDRPTRLFIQGTDQSVDLLIGSAVDGKHYAKLAGAPSVFTLRDLDSVLNAKPFSFMDKFALLLNIQIVDRLTVTGEGRTITAEINDQDEGSIFLVGGKKAEDKSFRKFYEAVIGLLIDAEYTGGSPGTGGNITIEYHFKTPPAERTSITLIPLNRDFYLLRQEGTTEFMISRSQVNRIFETADAIVFE